MHQKLLSKNNDVQSTTKYGFLLWPNAQTIALRAHCMRTALKAPPRTHFPPFSPFSPIFPQACCSIHPPNPPEGQRKVVFWAFHATLSPFFHKTSENSHIKTHFPPFFLLGAISAALPTHFWKWVIRGPVGAHTHTYTHTHTHTHTHTQTHCTAGLSLTQKKKLFQNQVISKEPTDNACLHSGVPNGSTMSP